MSGAVRFTRTLDGKSATAPGILLVEWPDKLRLEVQDPVGSLLVLLVVRENRFWLYDRARKENLSGSLRSLPGGLLVTAQMTDVARALLARPTWEIFSGATVEGRSARLDSPPQTIRWDDSRTLREWRKSTADGNGYSVQYLDFESRAGALYPTKLQLESKGAGNILLHWTEWEPSVPNQKKLFQIPQQQNFGRPTKALP